MPGAFIAGSIIAFIFMRRRSRDAELPGAGGQMGAAMPMDVSFKTGVSPTDSMSLTVDVTAAVMPHIRAGDQIAAIKLLPASAGVHLKTAKQIVDTIRASPLARQ